jgi:adenosylmethionine-8-amino-7-oxononanoate aminotransferase
MLRPLLSGVGLRSAGHRSAGRRSAGRRSLSSFVHPSIAAALSAPTASHLSADRAHLWHPYTSATSPSRCLPVARAEGSTLHLESGERLVDGMSSWWCAVHGYNHPKLNRAARTQLEAVSHVMFGGLTHRPAVALGAALVALSPEPLRRVFLADSGSVAVEVALKMALQYQRGRGRAAKTKFLAPLGGYEQSERAEASTKKAHPPCGGN